MWPDIGILYDNRKNILTGTLILQLVIAVVFAKASISVSGSCYTTPCYWKVSNGAAFAANLIAFMYMLQPIYGLYFLKKRCAQIVGGAFIGATLIMAVIALLSAVYWGSEIHSPETLVEALVSSNILPAKYSFQSLNTFMAMSVLSWTQFGLMALCYGLLCICRDYFCEDDYAAAQATARVRKNIAYQAVSSRGDEEEESALQGGQYV